MARTGRAFLAGDWIIVPQARRGRWFQGGQARDFDTVLLTPELGDKLQKEAESLAVQVNRAYNPVPSIKWTADPAKVKRTLRKLGNFKVDKHEIGQAYVVSQETPTTSGKDPGKRPQDSTIFVEKNTDWGANALLRYNGGG